MENRNFDDPRYIAWRQAVYQRDKWQCQLCQATGVSIAAHHITRWADSEQLRFVITNGITLCDKCHELVTGNEDKYADQFRRIVQQKILAGKRASKQNRGNKHHKNAKYIKNIKVRKLLFSPRTTLMNRRHAKPMIGNIRADLLLRYRRKPE